jgi:nucleotide-binding universal stress UspA family protein
VLGVSASASGHAALRAAVAEAVVSGAELQLVRAWREAEWLPSATSAGVAALMASKSADQRALRDAAQTARDACGDRGLCVLSELVGGDVYATLLARSAGADLLVLGAGGSPGVPGAVAQWLRQRVTCPVAVVDAHGEAVLATDLPGVGHAPVGARRAV